MHVMRSSRLFRVSLFLENGSILMIWGCFSIVSNVIRSNYCCRRHTMHGNMVFSRDSIFPTPQQSGCLLACSVESRQIISRSREIITRSREIITRSREIITKYREIITKSREIITKSRKIITRSHDYFIFCVTLIYAFVHFSLCDVPFQRYLEDIAFQRLGTS